MNLSYPANYAIDHYGNIFGAVMYHGWFIMHADKGLSLHTSGTKHAANIIPKIMEIDRLTCENRRHIFVDAIGNRDPFTWSCAMAEYAYDGCDDDGDNPSEIIYSPNESAIKLMMQCLTDAINTVPKNGKPIIIHTADNTFYNLIHPSKCIKYASNNWITESGTPVENFMEIQKYLRALDGCIVYISNKMDTKKSQSILKANKPKINYKSTVYIKSFN